MAGLCLGEDPRVTKRGNITVVGRAARGGEHLRKPTRGGSDTGWRRCVSASAQVKLLGGELRRLAGLRFGEHASKTARRERTRVGRAAFGRALKCKLGERFYALVGLRLAGGASKTTRGRQISHGARTTRGRALK